MSVFHEQARVLDRLLYGPVPSVEMSRIGRKGVEEARNQFSALLAAAEKGKPTIITKHGRPIAALVPAEQFEQARGQRSILALKGTGRGLWGRNSTATIRMMRDDWNR